MTDEDKLRYQEGLQAFDRARRRAFFAEVIGAIRGQPMELLSFEEIRARLRIHMENYRGLQDVPLRQIVGSVGRSYQFTREFLPKKSASRERWSRIYAQAIGLRGLPPIELYQIDDVYFVRDGNHRVSVARQLGLETIQAQVIELHAPIGLRPDMTAEELDATVCYADFLNYVRPMLPPLPPGTFKLTHPTAYNDLIGHVFLYQSVHSQKAPRPLSLPQAAQGWYRDVYTPVVEAIRKYEVLPRLFPQSTEADLYLWLTDHLRECEEELQLPRVGQPLDDFLVRFLREHDIPLPQGVA